MKEMKLILIILCCVKFSNVVTCNEDVKLTSGTLETESKEKSNNIPVDPGGNELERTTLEDPPVQVANTKENCGTTEDGEKCPPEKNIESENKPKEEPVKEQTNSAENKEPVISVEQKQNANVDTEMKEMKEIVQEQEETPDSPDTTGNKTETLPEKPGGDKLVQTENEVQTETEKSSTEVVQEVIPRSEQEKSKQGEEIQTFTEWTQKVLEEEKQKSATESPGSGVSKTKRSINYASKECGAKVLASNLEAENVKAILTSNKDEYMINPCKVSKKWFVLELCEPVHVSHLEVASFELFSSQPKTFRVHLSDRYPTKEWTNIGDLEAIEERTSQTFPIKEGYVVQFVKVEMLDHYGTEHFCPLTWFKVYGVPVEYDEYGHRSHEDHEDSDGDMDEVLLRNGDNAGDTDAPKNLFASATDTVMKLVKKVLNVEDKDQPHDSETNKTDPLTKALNDTNKNMTADGILLPCLQNKTDKEKKRFDGPLQPSPPHPHTGSGTKPTDNEEKVIEKDVSMVTKLEDHEQVPSVSDNLVTLIDSEQEDTVSCDKKMEKLASMSHFRKPICKFYDLMHHTEKYPTCSINESIDKDVQTNGKSNLEGDKQADVKISDKNDENGDKTGSQISIAEDKGQMEQKDQKLQDAAVSSTDSSSSTQEPQLSTKTITSVKMDQTSDSPKSIEPTASLTQILETKKVVDKTETEIDTEVKQKVPMQDESQNIQPSSPSSGEDVKSVDTTPALGDVESSEPPRTADFILVGTTLSTPTQAQSEQTTKTVNVQPEIPSVDEAVKVEPSSATEIQQPPSLKINGSELEGPSTDMVEPVVIGDNVPAVQDAKDLKLIHVPILPYQKRETAIMRLNNRLKALEMNVSLSSRFLEEMSQKFKKQTEDMIKQHVFNKTIGELTNVTKAIEMQSQIQKQKIDVLETKIQNLTEVVLRLTENFDNLNQQVQDREFKYLVTIVIFIVVILILMKKRLSKVPPEIEEMGTLSNLTHVRRRNSYSGCEHDRIDTIGPAIQKYNSESTLVNHKSFSSSSDPVGTNNHHVKKKKKKKHKTDSTSSFTDQISAHKTDINSAGLLFGTSSRETTPEDQEVKRSINRSESFAGIWNFFSSDKQEQVKPKGPDKKEPVNTHAKSNGCLPKKYVKASTGKICQPAKQSNGYVEEHRSYSVNGFGNHHSADEDDPFRSNNVTQNNIVIVSPLRKGLSFSKGSSQNNHKDPLLKSQTGKHGRSSHSRAGSSDLTYRSVTFREMNGHR